MLKSSSLHNPTADVCVTDVGVKRAATSQEKQTLQLRAFPERPGNTKTPFNVGK